MTGKKIITAIRKANAEVEVSERAGEEMIDAILDHVEREYDGVISVEAIQDMIESSLVNKNKYTLSKKIHHLPLPEGLASEGKHN